MTMRARPAGQAKATAEQAVPPKAAPAVSAPAPRIGVAPDGRVTGIDGMLDQVAAALMRQAQPIIESRILPALQRDKELQKTVGESIGEGTAKQLRPWVILGTLSLAALAVTAVVAVARPRRDRKSVV